MEKGRLNDGKGKIRSEGNSEMVQTRRMHEIREAAWWKGENQRFATFFEFLQALGTVQKEKAVKEEGTRAEAYQDLSYEAKLILYQKLKNYFMGLTAEPPKEWKFIEYSGLPKVRDVESMDDFRWIAKI